MSIAIDPLHLQYFRKNRQIEFENLLPELAIRQIDSLFEKKVAALKGQLPVPLKVGFDLWRNQEELKKIICSVKFAKMAGQLMEVEKIRYGFSQLLTSNCFCDDFTYLHRKSCIKNLFCGLCICLEPSSEPENPFFPTEKGHGIFFDIDCDFFLRFPKTKGQYLFIFYATSNSYYSYEIEDPLNLFFREMGYEHGDRLKENLHPSYSWMLL